MKMIDQIKKRFKIIRRGSDFFQIVLSSNLVGEFFELLKISFKFDDFPFERVQNFHNSPDFLHAILQITKPTMKF